MHELTMDELKTIALDILVDFDRVCEQLNLRYSIAFGTMIGAVRHSGFIPWDDDIDVIMPREDYNVLTAEGRNLLKPHHKLLSINDDVNFGAPLPKIIDTNTKVKQRGHISEKMEIGVYIDIFILDKIPIHYEEQIRIFKKCQFWHSAWRFTGNAPTRNNSKLVGLLRKFLNRTNLSTYFARRLMNVDKLTEKYKSDLYSILLFKAYSYEKNIQKLEEFDDCIKTDFNGYQVRMLGRYDDYLKSIYGDYMKFPPLEQQVSHHSFTASYK